jgi:hypothetical protein
MKSVWAVFAALAPWPSGRGVKWNAMPMKGWENVVYSGEWMGKINKNNQFRR